jgi:hypothetical protein
VTQPPQPEERPAPALPGDVEPTREITVPPGPPPAPDAETAPEADAVAPVVADQPTERLAPAEVRLGAPRRRSRTPFVLAVLVALIVAVGVVAVLVYGR